MLNRAVAASVLVLHLLIAPARSDDEAREAVPEIERLPPQAFIAEAQRFFAENPDTPDGPRLAMDLLMAGTVVNNADAVKQAQTRLCLDYSGSTQASYAMSTMQSQAQPKGYAKFLSTVFDENVDRLDDYLTKRFTKAVELGIQRIGNQLFSHSPLALRCALVARETGDYRLEAVALSALPKNHDQIGPVVEILTIRGTEAVDRIRALHVLRENAEAQVAERFLISRLPETQRQQPDVQALVAMIHLRRAKLADALRVLDGLSADVTTAQLLYCRGWCHASTGDNLAAVAAWDELRESFPDSPWCAPTEELSGYARGLHSNLRRYARSLLSTVTSIKHLGSGAMEATFTIRPPGERPPLTLYFGAVPAHNRLEILLRDDFHVVAAYRSHREGCSFYFVGEPLIYQVAAPLVLAPTVEFRANGDGSFSWRASVGIQNTLADIPKANQALLESKYLTTLDGVLELLMAKVRSGWIPVPPKGIGGDTVCQWVRAQPDTPQLERFEWRTSADGRVLSILSTLVESKSLRYGRADDIKLAPPGWPELPVATRQQIDPALLLRAAGALLQAFTQGGQDQPETAGVAVPKRR